MCGGEGGRQGESQGAGLGIFTLQEALGTFKTSYLVKYRYIVDIFFGFIDTEKIGDFKV